MSGMASAAARAAVMLALAGPALAGEPAAMTDTEVTNRLQFIQGSLDGGQEAANLWWYGWLIGYGGAAVQQFIAHSNADNENRKQDTAVGYVTSAIGVVGQLVAPLEACRLAARLREMPGDTPEARRAKLAAAEGYLRRSAAQEAFGRSWKMHAITAAVNLGTGLFLWLHYNRPDRDGLGIFCVGQVVSEIQIFTQPMRAVRDLREYEGRSEFDRPATAGAGRPTWYVVPTPRGLVVGCRF